MEHKARPPFSSALALLWLLALVGFAHAEPLADSVVQLRAIDSGGAIKFGSGVMIGAERIVTACHVTRHAATIEIVHGTRRWVAERQVGSPVHDLCVLSVPGTDVPIARVRDSAELRLGEPVVAAGFQGGATQLVVRRGTVAALYPYDDAPVIRTNAAFDFGSSGGALFDEAGNLVGVLAFKARTGEGLRFALPTEWLSARSAVGRNLTPLEPGSMAYAFWERPQDARPAFLGVAMREAATERN